MENDGNNEPVNQHHYWSDFLILLAIMSTLWGAFLFFNSPITEIKYPVNNAPPSANYCLTNQQLIILGQPLKSEDADKILVQIKNDLKISTEVVMLEGSYWNTSGILVASFPKLQTDGYSFSKYYIIIDSNFYKSLNSEEKKAVIGHEMGHIKGVEQLTNIEIDADTFATKYVSPQTFIDLLNKAIPDENYLRFSKQYKLRMESLEKIKKSKQGQVH